MCITLLGLIMSLGSCEKDSSDPQPPVTQPKEIGRAQAWLTTGDKAKLLNKENDVSLYEVSATTLPTITVDAAQKLQQIEGFGAALTGSSAYLINQEMNESQRNSLLTELFDPQQGIGISYIRITMGASDFSRSNYTYDDMPPGETDYTLNNFSIQKDKEDVVPVLKKITTIAPNIGIMATPWSPPAWMKTTENLVGGKLKAEAYDVYAQYFVKYIKAMKEEGIAVASVTPQNEPLFSTAAYPCTDMPAEEQLAFVKGNLGPAFQAAALQTDIIVYDHNWDRPDYVKTILNDAETAKYVTGSAFHAYAGSITEMTNIHNAYPDKGVYFTEISGTVGSDFSGDLQWNMANIFIGGARNWAKTALLWNLALDQSSGPKNNGCNDCRGVVTVSTVDGTVARNVEYYAIGHFSKFIRPGAYRIASSISAAVAGLDYVAFINIDGTKAIVVSNDNTAAKSFAVKDGELQFSYFIPAKAVATITW